MRVIILPLFFSLALGTVHGLSWNSLEDSEPNPPLWSVPNAAEQDVIRNFVSATLGSNMVLQRDVEAMLWGYTQPGATVTTSLRKEGETQDLVLTTTAAGDDGLWRQPLPPNSATMTPTSMTIKSTSGEKKTLENVLFGDVYLCGGQS